jgi:hypothetical protein
MPEYVVKLADGPGAVCSLVSEVFAEDDVLSDDGEASLEVDVADLGGKPVAQPKLLERFVGGSGVISTRPPTTMRRKTASGRFR